MKLFTPEQRDSIGSSFLSGKDFEGAGLTLDLMAMTAIKSEDPQYGAKEDGNGLKAGETWQYTFKTVNGVEKTLKNASSRLANAFVKLDPELGERFSIKRTGTAFDTEWFVERVAKS